MAATDSGGAPAGALLAAALALPGIVPHAQAQTVPDTGYIQFKYLDYRDWQPGGRRMEVDNPGFYVLKPLSDTLVIEGSVVYDGMSGASPLYFNALSGASGEGVSDYRTAGDVKLTKYLRPLLDRRRRCVFARARLHLARGLDRGSHLDRRQESHLRASASPAPPTASTPRTAPRNASASTCSTSSSGSRRCSRRRRSCSRTSRTRAATATSPIRTSCSTTARTIGGCSPGSRATTSTFPSVDGTLQLAYRYLDDSFGADSNMLEAAWVQPLPQGWSVRPSLRYYTQKAAYFFYGPPIGSGFRPGEPYTADTRLSAFGAWTPGILIAKELRRRLERRSQARVLRAALDRGGSAAAAAKGCCRSRRGGSR